MSIEGYPPTDLKSARSTGIHSLPRDEPCSPQTIEPGLALHFGSGFYYTYCAGFIQTFLFYGSDHVELVRKELSYVNLQAVAGDIGPWRRNPGMG